MPQPTASTMILLASDHAGVRLKSALNEMLGQRGIPTKDLGPYDSNSVDYPDFAEKLCKLVLTQNNARGLLICGSGIGMSIAANRHKGIRAALCRSVEDAKLSRQHNNANVLCLGERSTDEAAAKEILNAFLNTAFEGGRHEKRVEKLG